MIVDVHLVPYELPFRRPIRAGSEIHQTRRGMLVGLEDDEGRTGWGDAAPLAGFSTESLSEVDLVLQGLSASIVDRPRDLEFVGRAGVGWLPTLRSAAAALDCALLDLISNRAGRSVAAQLSTAGNLRASVRVNALISDDTPQEVSVEGASAASEGFTAFKVKVGRRPIAIDVARIAALRGAVGPAASLRVDAGGAWAVDEAIDVLRRVEMFDVEYVEDPVGDMAGFVQLVPRVGIPLAVDELLAVSADPFSVVAAAPSDIFVLKPAAMGGLQVARAVADRVMERGGSVVVTSLFDNAVGLTAAVHLAATTPAQGPASGLATSRFLAEDVAEPPPIVNGHIQVPAGPGLGISPVGVAIDRGS